jgi:hypothetical protein
MTLRQATTTYDRIAVEEHVVLVDHFGTRLGRVLPRLTARSITRSPRLPLFLLRQPSAQRADGRC